MATGRTDFTLRQHQPRVGGCGWRWRIGPLRCELRELVKGYLRMTDSLKTFKNLLETPELPALGPIARSSRLALLDLNQRVDRFLAQTGLDAERESSVRSAALLWQDYLAESHSISQNIHGADGSMLHGIMHRREPDYPNAKYWFHRVGNHRAFPDIAKQVTRLLATKGETELAASLAPRGEWDPFAFVDACQQAVERPMPDTRIQVLQTVQQIEFDCLLTHLFEA